MHKPTIYESSLRATPELLIVDRRRAYLRKLADLVPVGDEAYEHHMRDLALRQLKGEGIKLSLWRPRADPKETTTGRIIPFHEVRRGHK